jgi:hydrogenase/urease accessory protein HupE
MNTIFKLTAHFLVLFIFVSTPFLSRAHAPDQGYLYLSIHENAIDGRFELIAKDINRALGTALPDDLTMEQLEVHLADIQAYFRQRTSFTSAGGNTYRLKFSEPTILDLNEMEDYIRFHFELEGVSQIPDQLDITYNALFDVYPKHRGWLIMEYNWKAGVINNQSLATTIFTPDHTAEALDLTDASVWKGFWALTKLGVWHIWIGLDHILFIVALILPAVVRRRKEEDEIVSNNCYSSTWKPVGRFRPAFLYIIKIITFFTIAHSITLALASLGVVNLSSRLVESIIAVSIALAAYHNIQPVFKGKEWIIAFVFGLFHGFGFASVLGEKGISGDYLVPSLLGFNLGVEIGQVLIICLVFPLLFLIRKNKIYPKIITYGSVLLILISLYWAVERAFEVDLTLGTYFWKFYHSIFG